MQPIKLSLKFILIVLLIANFTSAYATTYAPKLILTSDLSSLAEGQGTRIRWYASRATSCRAQDRWTNSTATEGKHWVSSINQTTTFTLTCFGPGGSITKSVRIARIGNDDGREAELITQAPTLVLTSDLSSLNEDQGTRIRWQATDANSCSAVGGWTDKTGTTDKHWVSSIAQTTTYTLTCSGQGGSVTKSITIARKGNDSSNENTNAPKLILTSDLSSLAEGQGTRIRWQATDAESCSAAGGWTDKTGTTDKHWVSSIAQTTTYTLTCSGQGGSITKSITIALGTAQESNAILNLSKNGVFKDSTGSYHTTVHWTSNNTQSCIANGGWSNRTGTSGKQYIYPINKTTTYSMTCSGSQGSVTKSITVSIDEEQEPENQNVGSVELNWQAPTTNQDGTQLTDLSGYKIYFGTSQNSLSNIRNIDAGLTRYVINNLSTGTYYFSISAVDINGNESTRSNIASRVVN